MLSNLLKARASSRARIPPGRRVYVVGDVHGRSDLLAALHRQIVEHHRAAGPAAAAAVYLGDYIDRGPSSFEVVDMLVNEPLEGFERVHLKGNHEDMMLSFLDGAPGETWLFNGGDATLVSYGIPPVWAMPGGPAQDELRQRLREAMPVRHRQFFESLELRAAIGGYLFVHAGIRPGVPLDAQRPSDLVWIRDRFLESKEDFGVRVVHGHTITAKPEVRPNRIGIDTGAFYSNRLTCLVLEDERVGFLHT